MPSYKTAFPSRWLKADDCNPPIIDTITSVGFEDVGSGADVQRKLVVRFAGREPGFVLNITNANTLAALLGTEDYEAWVGQRICLGTAKVTFQNKFVDAIRVQPVPARKPRPGATRSNPPAAAPPVADDADDSLEEPDGDVGF